MSQVIDLDGAIIDPMVLRAYERIAGPCHDDGQSKHPEQIDSAEAFLKLVLRYEAKGELDRIKRIMRV